MYVGGRWRITASNESTVEAMQIARVAVCRVGVGGSFLRNDQGAPFRRARVDARAGSSRLRRVVAPARAGLPTFKA